MQQPHHLAHFGGAPGHDDQAGEGLVGGEPVHGVGCHLGPPVTDPAVSNDLLERLDERGVHSLATMLGILPPLPLLWANRWIWSPASTVVVRIGSRRVSA